ncbi:MAG: Maf family protein [Candidatus Kapabacteria bacterium]|nr:Maf family protein [Candidatus Kapabacteria bacterium]
MNIKSLLNINRRLVLASGSPRRKKLLEDIGFEFEVITSNVDEGQVSEMLEPSQYVMELALLKAKDVSQGLISSAIVIGADTTVVLNNKIINKPIDTNDAFRILSELSDNTHKVYTGIAFVDSANNQSFCTYQETEVTFRKLSEKEIWAYIESGSPMDKAGAYGIQDDFGAVFVNNINGCYYNIVGLPLELFYISIKRFLNLE